MDRERCREAGVELVLKIQIPKVDKTLPASSAQLLFISKRFNLIAERKEMCATLPDSKGQYLSR